MRAARDPLPALLLALTAATGLVDAVSYLGLGRVFTANQTGNVVFLAFAWAGAPGLSATASVVSLLAFAVGSALGGAFARRHESRRREWLLGALAGEAALSLSATVAAIGLDAGGANARREVVIALLAFAMGLRNATVRRLGVPDLTTTVLTMTLTGLTAERPAGGGTGPTARRVGSVVAMFLGAVVGAALVVRGHLLAALVLLSAILAVLAAVYAVAATPRPADGAA